MMSLKCSNQKLKLKQWHIVRLIHFYLVTNFAEYREMLLLFFLQYLTCYSLTVEWMQDFMNATVFIYFLLCICTSEYTRFLPVHNTISILIH